MKRPWPKVLPALRTAVLERVGGMMCETCALAATPSIKGWEGLFALAFHCTHAHVPYVQCITRVQHGS